MPDNGTLADVSRETIDDLRTFEHLVVKWSPKINLIAKSQIDDIWERHIVDSWQLTQHIPTSARSLIDIGSGGGFPGIVLAIFAKHQRPDLQIDLIESDQRKCAFLRTAIRELILPATVETARIENSQVAPADVVTARALAPMPELLALTDPLLKLDGIAIFPKGENYATELEIAEHNWRFACIAHPSSTHNSARILVMRDIHRGEKF